MSAGRDDAIIASMSQLIVRNLDARIVQRLRARAVARNRSAEAEHRAILEAALGGGPPAGDFKSFLLAMPATPAWRPRRSKDRGRRTIL